jgi:hypothetical protein
MLAWVVLFRRGRKNQRKRKAGKERPEKEKVEKARVGKIERNEYLL